MSKSNELSEPPPPLWIFSDNPNEIPTVRPDNENVSNLRLMECRQEFGWILNHWIPDFQWSRYDSVYHRRRLQVFQFENNENRPIFITMVINIFSIFDLPRPYSYIIDRHFDRCQFYRIPLG